MPGRYWGKVDTFRQTCRFSGRFTGCLFHDNPNIDSDFIIVCDNNNEWKNYPKEKRIFVVMENPSIWKYPDELTDQMGVLITPFKEYLASNAPRVFVDQPAVPWFYGIDFDTTQGLSHNPEKCESELVSLSLQEEKPKTKLIAMFTSSKSALPGHRWRILVAKELKAMFGNQCDIFGFGHKPVKNKNQGIDDYKFSIVIENDSNENYWTEKLSDTLLGYSCPIYSGADNVQDFFHHHIPSFTFGSDPKSTVQKIIKIIDSMDAATIQKNVDGARGEILYRHNLFAMLSRQACK